jgi:hypothetical protein
MLRLSVADQRGCDVRRHGPDRPRWRPASRRHPSPQAHPGRSRLEARTAPRWRQASSTSRYLLRRDERFGAPPTCSPRPAEASAPQQRSPSGPCRAPSLPASSVSPATSKYKRSVRARELRSRQAASTRRDRLARRVRKFGHGRFVGESCRGPGRRDWRIGVAAVTLATAGPPFLWSRAEDATRRTASSRRPEHRLERELQQRREGRANLAVTGHPDGTEKSLANAHAPARVALFRPPPCKVAAEVLEATGSGFPWKSAGDRAYEPYGW